MKRTISCLLTVTVLCGCLLCGSLTASAAQPTTTYKSNSYKDFIKYREPLTHTYQCLTQKKSLNVTYFGGSVSAGYGSNDSDRFAWRGLSVHWLMDNFPNAKINVNNSTIGGQGTYLGTYRLSHDVLCQNPDLVFIEYAINDNYSALSQERAALQYETVVRELRKAFPKCDIVTLLVTDQGVAAKLPNLYATAAGHEQMAKAYNITTLNVGGSLFRDIGGFKNWSNYFIDTVHPNDNGYGVYFKCVKEYLENMLLNTNYSGVADSNKTMPAQQSAYLLDGGRVSAFGEDMKKYVAADSKNVTYSTKKYFNLALTPYYGYYGLKQAQASACLSINFTGTELSIWTNFDHTCKISYSLDGAAAVTIGCDRNGPTQVVKKAAPGAHNVKIKAVSYGSVGNLMQVGGIFIRDASKQTVKAGHTHSFGEWETQNGKQVHYCKTCGYPEVKGGATTTTKKTSAVTTKKGETTTAQKGGTTVSTKAGETTLSTAGGGTTAVTEPGETDSSADEGETTVYTGETEPGETEPTETTVPADADPDENNGVPLWVWIAIAAVVLIGGGLAVFFATRKKPTENK